MNLKDFSIKAIYFYLVSLISLLVILFNLQSFLVTGFRYFIFKTAPEFTYAPSFFPFFDSGIPVYVEPFPKEAVSTSEAQNKELLLALKSDGNLTDEQRVKINQWFTDYDLWKKSQEDERKRVTDSLLGSLVSLFIFTPAFIYHFRRAREI